MKKSVLIAFLILSICTGTNAQISSTSFAAHVDFTVGTGTVSPARLATADLNADGKMDVIVPNNGNTTLSVFRNTNTGTGWYSSSFTTQSTITSNANLQGVVLADLDGDGKPDMITTHGNLGGGGGSTSIYVYQNGSSTGGSIGFFTGTAFTTGGANPASAVAGDIDGDGKLDLVIANYGNGITSTGSIVVLRNTSSGVGSFTFVASSVYTTNINTPYDVKLADFDNDGKLDIVASCYITSGYVSVYKNNSTSGSITLNAVNTFTAGTQPGFLSVGDIDGDGKSDIVVSNYGSANASVFRNTTTVSGINFATAVNFTTGTNPQGNILKDFDGDGKLDLALANRTSGTLAIYKNTSTVGTISAATAVTFATNNSPMGMVAPDLDGDSKPEIIISNQGTTNISVFRNQILAAKPTTAASNLSFSGISSSSVTLSWTNGNGARRIVLAKALSAVNSNPSDSFTYTANSTFASGSQIGSGNYAVYNDSGNTVTVTGLTTGTTYYFTIYEYNGSGSYASYLISPTLSGSQIISSAVYYSKSTGALNTLSTWGTNTDGTGTAPTSFTANNAIYFVWNNSSPSITANWTVTGTGALIVFGDGTNAFNLSIPSGYTLSSDTISVKSSGTLTIQGTLAVNKAYYDINTTAQYLGTSAYIAPGNYYTLATVGSSKTLTGNVVVRNLLNMSNNINLYSYSLTLGTGPSQTGSLTRVSGTIIGSFSRWFNATTNVGTTGLFPIGTSYYYRPIQIEYSTAPSAGGILTASYIASNPGSTGLPLFDFTIAQSEYIDKQSADGYWNIAASQISGGTYTATATGTGIIGVSSYSDLRMIKRTNSTSAWTLPGTAVSGAGSNSAPIVARTGLTGNASDFGIGSDQTINALPVKLIILTVHQLNNFAMLNWQTASEVNSDHFEIERSLDNNSWKKVSSVDAAGNSSELRDYAYNDNIRILIAEGVNTIYYRMKLVDKDGAVENSNVIALNVKSQIGNITLYPLPLNQILKASVTNGEQVQSITLYDMSGKEIITSSGEKLDVTSVSEGIYIAKVTTDKEVYFTKVSK